MTDETKIETCLLSERPSLFHAMDGFLRSQCNFESSIPINTAIEELGNCDSLQAAFKIPLQHHLINMESALKWVLFLTVAPAEGEKDGDMPFHEQFSSQDAIMLITEVYDLGVQDLVWEHFEDDDEESDEESDAEDAASKE